jgi:hypothetical protein
MLYFLISMLIMAALFDRATRRGRIDLVLLDTRFKLFALRDKLRNAAIAGEVPENKWFEYLDTTITKSIDMLPGLTVWEVAGLFAAYRQDESVLRAQTALFQALGQDENKHLAHIYAELVVRIGEVLFLRHLGTRYLMSGVVFVARRAQGLKKKFAQIVTVAPETSTLTQYTEA